MNNNIAHNSSLRKRIDQLRKEKILQEQEHGGIAEVDSRTEDSTDQWYVLGGVGGIILAEFEHKKDNWEMRDER